MLFRSKGVHSEYPMGIKVLCPTCEELARKELDYLKKVLSWYVNKKEGGRMMEKFNIGDWVRVAEPLERLREIFGESKIGMNCKGQMDWTAGELGEVSYCNINVLRVKFDNGQAWNYPSEALTLLEDGFKVGDVVEIIQPKPSDLSGWITSAWVREMDELIGKAGTVIAIQGDEITVEVEVEDENGVKDTEFYFPPFALKLIGRKPEEKPEGLTPEVLKENMNRISKRFEMNYGTFTPNDEAILRALLFSATKWYKITDYLKSNEYPKAISGFLYLLLPSLTKSLTCPLCSLFFKYPSCSFACPLNDMLGAASCCHQYQAFIHSPSYETALAVADRLALEAFKLQERNDMLNQRTEKEDKPIPPTPGLAADVS